MKETKFKQTEIVMIPDDWEVKELGELFSIKHGFGFKSEFFSDENNQKVVVTPGNFKLDGGFQYQNKDFIIIVFYSLIITLRLEVN